MAFSSADWLLSIKRRWKWITLISRLITVLRFSPRGFFIGPQSGFQKIKMQQTFENVQKVRMKAGFQKIKMQQTFENGQKVRMKAGFQKIKMQQTFWNGQKVRMKAATKKLFHASGVWFPKRPVDCLTESVCPFSCFQDTAQICYDHQHRIKKTRRPAYVWNQKPKTMVCL